MQKWEYEACWVYHDDEKKGWYISMDEGVLNLFEGLDILGDGGWEMVGTALSIAQSGGGRGYERPDIYMPCHWLYFKRPKA
jgi:hypothetical protein